MCGFALNELDLSGCEVIAREWRCRHDFYVDMHMRSPSGGLVQLRHVEERVRAERYNTASCLASRQSLVQWT